MITYKILETREVVLIGILHQYLLVKCQHAFLITIKGIIIASIAEKETKIANK